MPLNMCSVRFPWLSQYSSEVEGNQTSLESQAEAGGGRAFGLGTNRKALRSHVGFN